MSTFARVFIVLVAVLGLTLATTHPTLAKGRWKGHVVAYCDPHDCDGSDFEAVIENGEESRVVGTYDTYDEAHDAAKDAAREANRGFKWDPACEDLPPDVLC
jgi:hypothetical protein